MDDGDAAGNNELIRLRTSSGHQLLMHDTKGVVYLANASGNVWMEFSANGAIDIYSGNTVSLRAVGDIDLHSDNNINMFAKGQIKLSAMNKLVLDGGMIQTYSDTDTQIQSGGSFTNKALTGSIITSAGMTQLHMATDQHHLTGKQIHFNSITGSPDMIATYERTVFYDDSGTGTLRETKPDVDLTKKGLSAPLEWTQEGNVSMSGLRMPTHEPFPGHWDDIVSFAGTEDATDSNVPGTVGFLSQQCRESDNSTLRICQYQADLATYMGKQNIAVTDVKKLQSVAEDFTKNYNERYNLTDNGPFSISPIAEGVSSTIKQTIESVTGSSINLLKDQVFVNQGGVLYSAGNLGQALTGSVQGVINDLSSGKGVFTTAGNVLGGVQSGLNNLQNLSGNTIGNAANQALGGVTKQISSIIPMSNQLNTDLRRTKWYTPFKFIQVKMYAQQRMDSNAIVLLDSIILQNTNEKIRDRAKNIIEELKTKIDKLIKRKAREIVYQDNLEHKIIKILEKNNITNEINSYVYVFVGRSAYLRIVIKSALAVIKHFCLCRARAHDFILF
jgi:hypothetical protein